MDRARRLVVLVLALTAGPAIGQELKNQWKFDVVHLHREKSPLTGLIVAETPQQLVFKSVLRRKGRPTVVLDEIIPRKAIAKIERLDEDQRAELSNRIEALERERSLLAAQTRLWKGGKVELPPEEAVPLEQAPWGKDGKRTALAYKSQFFKLVSSAREDLICLTAIQLEQIYAAFSRCLPPQSEKSNPVTILLAGSMKEYRALVEQSGHDLLNPAFYDPGKHLIVCGSDIERLSAHLARARQHNEKLRKELLRRREELKKSYGGSPPVELDRPIREALYQVLALEKKNEHVLMHSHLRLLQRLTHEAFHAYLADNVFPDHKGRLPPWLDEGLAQIFETALLEGGELSLGPLHMPRLEALRKALRKDGLMPLTRLLQASRRDFQVAHAADKQVSNEYYLASWALAWYLTFDRKVLGSRELEEYLRASARGDNPLTAFRRLVGQSLEEFEKEFRWHMDNVGPDGNLARQPPKK